MKLTGNNDMHLKNFSMIFQNNKWTLAPAYDLLNVAIVNPEDTEELALTLEGKKRKLHWEHFQRLGLLLGLNAKQINGIAKRFQKRKPVALQWIDRSFLSDEYKEKYKDLLEKRYQRIEGWMCLQRRLLAKPLQMCYGAKFYNSKKCSYITSVSRKRRFSTV